MTGRGNLRVIAVFKLLKAASSLLVAAAAFDLVRSTELQKFATWVEHLPIQHGHSFLIRFLDGVLQLGPHKFIAVGTAACIYACLFMVEGLGLWYGKRWAEYVTVAATILLVPFGVYEAVNHVTVAKIIALLINIAITVYLVRVLMARRE